MYLGEVRGQRSIGLDRVVGCIKGPEKEKMGLVVSLKEPRETLCRERKGKNEGHFEGKG